MSYHWGKIGHFMHRLMRMYRFVRHVKQHNGYADFFCCINIDSSKNRLTAFSSNAGGFGMCSDFYELKQDDSLSESWGRT